MAEPADKTLAKSTLPLWNCELKPLTQPVNVGTHMSLSCQGDFVEKMSSDLLRFEFKNKEEEYSLVILEKKNIDNQRLDLVVTSYKAGEHKWDELMIGDGTTAVRTSPMQLTVETVIDQQKKVEPFGPFGPFEVAMPWWYWGTIAIILLAVFLLVFRRLKRYFDRKKLIESLAAYNTALTPFHQFNKDLRALLKTATDSVILVNGLNKVMREYILRQFVIPTFVWSDREILNEFKKRQRKFYRENSGELAKLFRELERATSKDIRLNADDCDQLVSMCKVMSEKMNAFVAASAKGG